MVIVVAVGVGVFVDGAVVVVLVDATVVVLMSMVVGVYFVSFPAGKRRSGRRWARTGSGVSKACFSSIGTSPSATTSSSYRRASRKHGHCFVAILVRLNKM